MNINRAVVKVEKGSSDRLSSVLNVSQRISNKIKIFNNFILFWFLLGKALINIRLLDHTQSSLDEIIIMLHDPLFSSGFVLFECS